MITDIERREVARRLREFAKDKWSLTVGGNSSTIRYAISDIVFGDKKYHSGVDLINRLADLIEPNYPEVKCVDSIESKAFKPVESDGISRDTLLALADEMDMDASCYAYVDDYNVNVYARRIREALGE